MVNIRLCVVSVIIGLIAGVVAYLFQSKLVDERIQDLALTATKHFEETASRVISVKEGPWEHDELVQKLGRGNLIGIRIFDAVGKLAFDSWTAKSTDLTEILNAHLHVWPESGSDHQNRIELKEGSLIQVVMPLMGKASVVGYLEGIYLLDSATLSNMRRQVFLSIATAIASSFAVGLVLFPILNSLYGKVTRLSDRLLTSNLSLIKSLGAAVAKRDSDTDVHNYRVALYAVALAESIVIPREEICNLLIGAFLHDVGKIGIPDHILRKPGKLNSDEFSVMKSHATIGLDIIAGNEWLKDAACVIRHHHERFDGTGYPDGLKGLNIPLGPRIFAVVDVFDALVSVRPYKPALSLDVALDIIQNESGRHFDPIIVMHFLKISSDCHSAIGSSDVVDLKILLEKKLKEYF